MSVYSYSNIIKSESYDSKIDFSEETDFNTTSFFVKNRRLMIFTSLFVIGAAAGTAIFVASGENLQLELGTILEVQPVPAGFSEGVSAFFSSCFSTLLLTALLFLSGMSACGVPVAAAVPFFFGLGMGMMQAYYYTMGLRGIVLSALLIAPQALTAGAALIMGSMECSRMSLLFSGKLLPSGSGDGLWSDFKLYIARFLIFLVICLGAGVLNVCLRLLILPLI